MVLEVWPCKKQNACYRTSVLKTSNTLIYRYEDTLGRPWRQLPSDLLWTLAVDRADTGRQSHSILAGPWLIRSFLGLLCGTVRMEGPERKWGDQAGSGHSSMHGDHVQCMWETSFQDSTLLFWNIWTHFPCEQRLEFAPVLQLHIVSCHCRSLRGVAFLSEVYDTLEIRKVLGCNRGRGLWSQAGLLARINSCPASRLHCGGSEPVPSLPGLLCTQRRAVPAGRSKLCAWFLPDRNCLSPDGILNTGGSGCPPTPCSAHGPIPSTFFFPTFWMWRQGHGLSLQLSPFLQLCRKVNPGLLEPGLLSIWIANKIIKTEWPQPFLGILESAQGRGLGTLV